MSDWNPLLRPNETGRFGMAVSGLSAAAIGKLGIGYTDRECSGLFAIIATTDPLFGNPADYREVVLATMGRRDLLRLRQSIDDMLEDNPA